MLSISMNKQKKIVPQKNKNNKTRPENLMKKEYLESYVELKNTITKNQEYLKRQVK